MIEPATIIGVISAVTALVASVTGPLVTFYVGRSQVRAAVLSANRQRWIDGFREVIAEFCSQIAAAGQMRERMVSDGKYIFGSQPELLRQFERLVFTFAKITLMTNPLDPRHKELLGTIEELIAIVRLSPADKDVQPQSEPAVRRIIDMSHAILRQEWVRVQRGA